MNRAAALLSALVPLLPVPLHAADGPGRAKPNVVVVITDDQGYGDLSCHANPVLMDLKTVGICGRAEAFGNSSSCR